MSTPITTPLLDDMMRGDEDPLSDGGNWDQVDPVDYPDQLQLKSGRAKGFPTLGSGVWTSRWMPLTLSGDMQLWAIPYQTPTVGWESSLRLLGNTGLGTSTLYGYIANQRHDGSGNATCRLYRMDNSVATLIDSQTAFGIWDPFDRTLLETKDDQVIVHWYDASTDTWNVLNQVTDNTYRTDMKLVLAVIESQLADAEWRTMGGGQSNTAFVPQIIRRWTTDH